MTDGSIELEKQIARLNALEGFVEEAAPKLAAAVEREILANVSRAVGPDGAPWPATMDGHKPLQGVANNLDVRAVGSVVVCRLVGVGARHHLGAVRGGRRRPILPSGKVPEPMTRAIETVLEAELARRMENS